MPVILDPAQVLTWLSDSWHESRAMVVPFTGWLDVVPVSNDVGAVKNNQARLLEPI